MMNEKLTIAVVGLGHVGLPLALAFDKKYSVIGYDSSGRRIKQLLDGMDETGQASAQLLGESGIAFTSDPSFLNGAGFIMITVATPIDDADQPDLSQLLKACSIVGTHMKKGAVVVFESTVYPGATEEKCIPVLEEYSGLESGVEFFVGYSPERFNPGERKLPITKIKKVVAGQNEAVLDYVAEIYGSVMDAGIFKAKSIRVAEAAKVIENTQQDVNIALINEFSMIFNHLGIDTGAVLETAGTKKSFLKFTPGFAGGPRLGIDSHYLAHKARAAGYEPEIILAGRKVNDGMGQYIARTVVKRLIQRNLPARGTRVTVLGITYKEDVQDLRNSKIIDVIEELHDYGFEVQTADCCADPLDADRKYGVMLTPEHELLPASAIILAMPHKQYKEAGWKLIQPLLEQQGGMVFDVKGILEQQGKPENIELWRL
ncbi:MAG TPA: nucleotide sugar dehydrogenase [Planococcus sp. (in: firmicutes)]|nr:nucleotide sugar dehydrogenase [Planococcus sp. (in: firmicutes)]